MTFCLPNDLKNKMLNALRDGTINPDVLSKMSSVETRMFFEKIVGRDLAKDVNAQYESKLLLKDQKRGLVTWAKKLTGIKEQARRDIVSIIDRMDSVLRPGNEQKFLADIASKRLGFDVTREEGIAISDASKEISMKRDAIPKDSPVRSKERRTYGDAHTNFVNYIKELQLRDPRSKVTTFKEYMKLSNAGHIIVDFAGASKSALASFDNSINLRQLIKVGLNPKYTGLWIKNFIGSFKLIYKELRNPGTALDLVKSDVVSRPNAINGMYQRMKLAVGLAHEEAFPVSFLGRIPILGRLFRASEAAYTGTALRIRADIADRMIAKAEKFGIDTTDPLQVEPIGKIANSLSGRGGLGKAESVADAFNVIFFSPRYWMANFNFLTAHMFNSGMTKFARIEAAQNLVNVIATTSALLFTADQLWPGSVTWDPNSSDFGKIKINNTRFDVTGGAGSTITLLARAVTPQYRKYRGKYQWGLWKVSSTTGKVTKLNSGKWGTPTVEDLVNNYWEGKLAPITGNLRDIARGRNFQGKKPTVGNVVLNSITPIPFQNFQELNNDPNSANILLSVILDGLGVSANTYGDKTKRRTRR